MMNVNFETMKKFFEVNHMQEELLRKAFKLNNKYYYLSSDNINSKIALETGILLFLDLCADFDTIIASMIYRSTVSLGISTEKIKEEFNDEIAKKVGLLGLFDTNLVKPSINNRFYMAKLIGVDVKVPIIKLVERIVTFHYIDKLSEQELADFVIETLDYYVPITKILGIYKLKNNLEDLCFRFDNNYEKTQEIKKHISERYNNIITCIKQKLDNSPITFKEDVTFKINQRSNYDIYRKALEAEKTVEELNNDDDIRLSGFCSIKCLVKSKQECYIMIYLIHQFMHQIGSFNDFIGGDQGNEYHSIHTNVFIDNTLVDFRICTNEMDNINHYGVVSDWKNNPNLQERLKNNYNFYNQLLALDDYMDKKEFVKRYITDIVDAKVEKNSYINIPTQKVLKKFYHDED